MILANEPASYKNNKYLTKKKAIFQDKNALHFFTSNSIVCYSSSNKR